MKIELEYPIEKYKDKFPFQVPRTIYRCSIKWGDENYYKTFEAVLVVGFVVPKKEWSDCMDNNLHPLIYDGYDYYPLHYDFEEEYYDNEQEARANFRRLYKEVYKIEYDEKNTEEN